MSDSEDPIEPIDEGGDDLFGDDDDLDINDAVASPKERVLDDDDLASDPEGDTYARYRDEDDTRQQDEVTRETMVAEVTAYRHSVPKPSDGVVSLTNFSFFSSQKHASRRLCIDLHANAYCVSTASSPTRPKIHQVFP
jgi:RNA polymerase-associated protein LEO1